MGILNFGGGLPARVSGGCGLSMGSLKFYVGGGISLQEMLLKANKARSPRTAYG